MISKKIPPLTVMRAFQTDLVGDVTIHADMITPVYHALSCNDLWGFFVFHPECIELHLQIFSNGATAELGHLMGKLTDFNILKTDLYYRNKITIFIT